MSRLPHPKEAGKEVLVLQCFFGLSQPLALIPEVSPLLSLLDGQKSIEEIEALVGPHGINGSHVSQLVTLLDQALLLENDRFFEARDKQLRDYAAQTVRSPALAGAAYPSNPEELQRELYSFLAGSDKVAAPEGTLETIITPHIDYRRGWRSYGKTFPLLRSRSVDVLILIGTCHQPCQGLFHLSLKDFSSPLGVSENAREFTRTLASRHGEVRSFQEELVHRYEHSLELQLPFLHLLSPGASIVPILVGSFHDFLRGENYPEQGEEYSSFSEALTETIREWRAKGLKVAILAGVDMAHIGPEFGDTALLSDQRLAEVQSQDRQYLEAIAARSKRKLFDHIAVDQDARRVCGFPTLYTILDVLERLNRSFTAEFVDYQQAVDAQRRCGVTFAGGTLVTH